MEDQSAWDALYLQAEDMKKELQEKLDFLKGCGHLEGLKSKLLHVSRRRVRLKRRKLVKREELAEDRFAEKDAAIDQWRMKRIRAAEEKKRVSVNVRDCRLTPLSKTPHPYMVLKSMDLNELTMVFIIHPS